MPLQQQPWTQLYTSMAVERDPRRQYVPPATDADLDQGEAEVGFRLPESYRAFMLQFGPGSLVGYWFLPVVPTKTRPPGTIAEATNKYREAVEKYPDDFPNGAWNSGVILFANYGPHEFAWHTGDKATKQANRAFTTCVPKRNRSRM